MGLLEKGIGACFFSSTAVSTEGALAADIGMVRATVDTACWGLATFRDLTLWNVFVFLQYFDSQT